MDWPQMVFPPSQAGDTPDTNQRDGDISASQGPA